MTLTLSEAIANAVLFAGDAKTDSKGLVRVVPQSVAIYFASYDDYIFLYQRVPMEEGWHLEANLVSTTYYVQKKDLKDAGEEGFINLLRGSSDYSQGTEELFEDLAFNLHEFPMAELDEFTFPSDRFGKISRIKGDEPCVIELGMDQGMKLAKFTKGEGVQGMMAFLSEGDSGD